MDTLRLDIHLPLRDFALELTLEVDGAPLALAGPSGAGKTTLLRAIAGLVQPERGRIELGGTVLFDSERGVNVPPEERTTGFVFQDFALFPHMTVRQNVSFGGDFEDAIERFNLGRLADERPERLSAGERQRVALARAIARRPRILLMDEPLAALDTRTRANVRSEMRELLAHLEIPSLIVTHDYQDAISLADRIGVMVEGRLLQLGTATELVAAPSDGFVATFTGANVIEGSAESHPSGLTRVQLDDGTQIFSADDGRGPVGVVVYPWDVSISLASPEDSALNHIVGSIDSIYPMGSRARVKVGPVVAEITVASLERLGLAQGRDVVASFKATATRLVRS